MTGYLASCRPQERQLVVHGPTKRRQLVVQLVVRGLMMINSQRYIRSGKQMLSRRRTSLQTPSKSGSIR